MTQDRVGTIEKIRISEERYLEFVQTELNHIVSRANVVTTYEFDHQIIKFLAERGPTVSVEIKGRG